MSKMSDYLEAALLNAVFRNTSYTSPTNVYLALYTAAPSDSGGGTECTGGSYARQAITFGAPSSGVITNSSGMSFTAMPAATVVAFGIFDAVSSGNLLMWNTLTTSVTVISGITLQVAAGDLTVTFD